MKVVLINHSDTRGGASVATMRLLHALREKGVDAKLLTMHKGGDDPSVVLAAPSWRSKIPFLAEHARIFASNGFTRSDLFAASIATDGLPLHRHTLVREADIVLLNWINQGMLSMREIERIALMGKRIIWTMHDMWNATGICHHTGDCERFKRIPGCGYCPLLHGRGSDNDISRRAWLRKEHMYDLGQITFVAVSRWLAEQCAKSSLLRDNRVEVIPNAFPVDEFYHGSRGLVVLPDNKKTIVMGAARLDDPVKGLPYAIEALNRIADSGRTDVRAVFYGALRNPDALKNLRLPYTHLGTITDKAVIADIFAGASAVLSSSLFESMGLTLIEGQASGAFPVSFDRGGQADIIDRGITGWLAPFGDTASLAEGLMMALDGQFSPEILRKSVAEKFSADSVADRYIKLFEE